MAKNASFHVTYDANADVLYITVRSEKAARGVEDNQGIVWRYAANGDVISATVMDFHDLWAQRPDDLATTLATHFQIPRPRAKIVVDHALQEERPPWLD